MQTTDKNKLILWYHVHLYYPDLPTPKPCQSGVFEKIPKKSGDWDLKPGDF